MHTQKMTPGAGLALIVAAWALGAPAAELGDYNGDGRVSPADAYFFGVWPPHRWGQAPFPPVEGAAVFDRHFSCDALLTYHKEEIVFHESLRRLSDSPLPHILEQWPEPEAPAAEQSPADERVIVEVVPLVHAGGGARLDLELRLDTLVPVDFAAFVLRGEGLDLRPRVERYGREYDVRITTASYLVSGGLLVYQSGFLRPRSWGPSEVVITIPVELPRGTRPGTYSVEFLEGTEVLTPEGEVLRPQVVPGTLEIRDAVSAGHDLPFPPLEFNLAGGKINGSFEARFTDAEGFPGDVVTMTLQVRAGRPVNYLRFFMPYDGRAIHVLDIEPLYPDPTLGDVRPEEYRYMFYDGDALSQHVGRVHFTYRAEDNHPATYGRDYHEGSLRYLAPLGDWIDLARLTVQIIEDRTGSGETSVGIDPEFYTQGAGIFIPYLLPNPRATPCTYRGSFDYEPTVVTPGRIVILGDGEPPPPPPPPIDPEEASIQFEVGNASGEPGDEVSVPVTVETAVELYQLRLVLAYEPTQLELVGFELGFENPRGQPGQVLLSPEEWFFLNRHCDEPQEGGRPECSEGFPLIADLHGEADGDEVPGGALVLDLQAPFLFSFEEGARVWEPGEKYELGSVRFRIRDEARAGPVEIRAEAVTWKPSGSVVEVRSETGGYPVLDPPPEERADVPAFEVLSGTVTITSERTLFIRGDADLSGDIVITDPVRTFRTLFQGAPPLPCDDSADANDDGSVDITDAIYTLQWLFLGGPEPPPPYPGAGLDTTEDALGCAGG